jgi:general nucleoside transport system ATP-binding protein
VSGEAPVPAVQMAGITKTYPGGVLANDSVSLAAFAGEIHAIVGENGAGKSTLMGVLYGSAQADQGRIRIRGRDERIDSPLRAITLGIGLVSQHTSMIPALTLWENATLGAEPGAGGLLSRKAAVESLERVAEPLGVRLEWNARAGDASVATLQKAEIVKALRRGASIVILDEPTAALAPPEADALFGVLHMLTTGGACVLLVTHRLREVIEHAARVTVLRGGRVAGERLAADASADELLAMMIGPRASVGMSLARESAPRKVAQAPWERETPHPRAVLLGGADSPDMAEAVTALPVATPMPRLEVRGIAVPGDRRVPAVENCTLSIVAGEIVSIAGVDGNGQRELAQAILGLRPASRGEIWLDGREITHRSVRERMALGLAYVPEDRGRDGLVADFSIEENLTLGDAGAGRMLDRQGMRWRAEQAITTYHIATAGIGTAAGTLSGGNQQKLLVARALETEPTVIVALQPTRGLDVAATRFVYDRLRDARARGAAVLFVSLDLDEILEIADRVAVMFAGHIVGVLPVREATAETVGRLMVGDTTASEGNDGS